MKVEFWILAGAAALLFTGSSQAGQAPAPASSGAPDPQNNLLATIADLGRTSGSLATANGAPAGTGATGSRAGGAGSTSSGALQVKDVPIGGQEWIQQQRKAGQPFRDAAARLGFGPANSHASSGFGSDAYKFLQTQDLLSSGGGGGIKISLVHTD